MKEIKHIAIIMDGNGRWAAKQGKPRTFGHKKGEESVVKVIKKCLSLGIKYLSLFAFSTENWKRSEKEVSTLFLILSKFLIKFHEDANKYGIRVKIMGDIEKLPKYLHKPIFNIIENTKDNKKLTLNIGLNYGGRNEIIKACNEAIVLGKEIDEKSFSKLLYTSDLPDPDLVIRTSGEQRFSNFMIYQCAYSELYFTDVLWPDFDGEELEKAIESYSMRERRYGDVK